jgi:hypothetical protein
MMEMTPMSGSWELATGLRSAVVGLAGFALAAANAAPVAAQAPADCVAPEPPTRFSLTRPVEPKAPACMDQRTMVSRCGAEPTKQFNLSMDAHNRAIVDYVEALNDYSEQLNRYQRDANRYANCEIQRINRESEAATTP